MNAYAKATIRRAKHDDKYFRMHRDTAQDKALSWEARGVIAYILSQSDTWDIQVHNLMQNCQKGRVYRILDELKATGYLEDRTKYRDDKGKWQWTPYILHERPITNVIEMPQPYPEKQDTGSPYPDFRDTEKRDTEKAEIKEDITNKIEQIKEQIKEKESPPTAGVVIPTDYNQLIKEIGITFNAFNSEAKLIATLLMGTSKAKGWKDHKLENPMNHLELKAFRRWYQLVYSDRSMVKKPEKINSTVQEWRLSAEYQLYVQEINTVKVSVAAPPVLTMTTAAPPVLTMTTTEAERYHNPPLDWIEAQPDYGTAEEAAELLAMRQNLFKRPPPAPSIPPQKAG